MSLYRTVERRKVYQEVVDQITNLILQSQLQPGDRLPPERRLAEELGVSRTAVREAVKALEERGLLQVRQGSGTLVRSLSPEVVSESLSLYLQTNMTRYLQLMELRAILDVEVAGRLAESIRGEDLDRLWRRIARMAQLLDSPMEYAEEDVAFHMDFYRAMNNDVLLLIMQPVMELLEEAMAASFEMPGSAERSLEQHRALVERIEAGDAEGAKRVTRELISRGANRLKREP